MTDPDGLHNYTYDDIYQLTDANYPVRPDQHYDYDDAGNRATVIDGANATSYTPDNMNRYTAAGTVSYGYDDNGCLTNKTEGVNTTTYGYDYENRLNHVIAGGSEAIYTYDYLGRRIRTNDNGTITRYIYDGNRVIAETDNAGNLICEYVYGNSIDEVLYMIKGSNTYYYHYDGLGSVRAITDSSEAIVETYTYDVYGKPTLYDNQQQEITTSSIGNRFYFTGREYDFANELYYYRARYYNPALGKFMSPDPLGPIVSPNLYTYCGNNPINWVDPLGLTLGQAIAQGSLISGGLAGAAYGIATGNPFLAGGGLIVAGIGAGWMWYDWITAPDLAKEGAQNIYDKYLKEHLDELDKISGSKK